VRSAAPECGYNHVNVHGLISYILNTFEVDKTLAKDQAALLVAEYCGDGGRGK